MLDIYKGMKSNGFVLIACLLLFVITFHKANAQENPPRPMALSLEQGLSFGAFFQSLTGGTVIITPTGVRSTTGSIILVNQGYQYFPCIIQVQGNPGTVVHILNGPDATLTGSNGGSMTMQIGNSIPSDPIIITAAPPGGTQVFIGGTLIVGNPLANPVGSYSGSFMIMFIQE